MYVSTLVVVDKATRFLHRKKKSYKRLKTLSNKTLVSFFSADAFVNLFAGIAQVSNFTKFGISFVVNR